VWPLDATINLTAGTVYHAVVDASAVAVSGRAYFGRQKRPLEFRQMMPYQLPIDPMADIMGYYIVADDPNDLGWDFYPHYDPNTTTDPGAYRDFGASFYSGSTAVSEGQPYTGAGDTAILQGGVSRPGQTFGISDKVIGPGNALATDSIWLRVKETATTKNCLVTIRKVSDFATVLATATITPATATGAMEEYALDATIQLEQGEDYVLLADFAEPDAAGTEFYKFRSYATSWKMAVDGSAVDSGPATYGGSEYCVVTQPWASSTYETFDSESDVVFAFTGEVVPEPATLSLLVIGGVLGLVRRRR
jgi:hypothetical protein